MRCFTFAYIQSKLNKINIIGNIRHIKLLGLPTANLQSLIHKPCGFETSYYENLESKAPGMQTFNIVKLIIKPVFSLQQNLSNSSKIAFHRD